MKYYIRALFNRFLVLINKADYVEIDFATLVTNYFFQRLFRINSKVPTSVHYTSRIVGYNRMKLGTRVPVSFAVSGGCFIYVFKGTTLEIGDGSMFAWNCCIQTGNHELDDRDKYFVKSVKIGKNCWLGNSVTILAGVELGDNVTVGANSVVTKSFPSNVVIAGCPAKIIKDLTNLPENKKELLCAE